MKNLNNLMIALTEHSSLEILFNLCKELRSTGYKSKDILNIIDEFLDENEQSRSYEEIIDEIISALEGYCHPSCSLA